MCSGKTIVITISNLMSVRNYFNTGLADSFKKHFRLKFLFDKDIFEGLQNLGQLPKGFDIDPIYISKNKVFKCLFSLFTLAHNATLYRTSHTKRMIVDQILGRKSSFLTKSLAKIRLNGLVFRIVRLCLLKFRVLFKNDFEIEGGTKPILVLTLPQSFLDFYVFLVLGKQVDKCVNQIFSWDNVTSRGPILNVPDYFFVWNFYVKNEIMKYYKYPEDQIKIVSVPFYDFFQVNAPNNNVEIHDSKKELTVLYTTGETSFLDYEPNLVEEIYKAMNERYDLRFIIRLHPLDKLSNYKVHKYSNVKIVEPTSQIIRIKDKEEYYFSQNDYQMYVEQLLKSDLILNIASTVTIDALILGKSVANINFMPKIYKGNKNINDYYNTEHYSKVVAYDLVPMIGNYGELFSLVDKIRSKRFSYKEPRMMKFKRDFFALESEKFSSTNRLIDAFRQLN